MNIIFTFNHCALAVSDLDASIAWYQDKLGFRIEKRFRLPDAHLEIAMLLSPGDLRLELLSRGKPFAAENLVEGGQGNGDMLRPGAMHLCFQVADVDAAAQQLERMGVKWIQEPKTIQPAGVRNCWIADLEGNPIEFIQPLDQDSH